jgi:hypothetical protein
METNQGTDIICSYKVDHIYYLFGFLTFHDPILIPLNKFSISIKLVLWLCNSYRYELFFLSDLFLFLKLPFSTREKGSGILTFFHLMRIKKFKLKVTEQFLKARQSQFN